MAKKQSAKQTAPPPREEPITIQELPRPEQKVTVELSEEELRRTVVALWLAGAHLSDDSKPFAIRIRGSEYKERATRLDQVFKRQRAVASGPAAYWYAVPPGGE